MVELSTTTRTNLLTSLITGGKYLWKGRQVVVLSIARESGYKDIRHFNIKIRDDLGRETTEYVHTPQ